MFEKKYGEKARELVYRRVSRARFPSLLSRTRPLSRLSSGIPTRGIHVAAAQGTGVMRSCSSLPPPSLPSLCNWIRAVEKNRIHSTNSSWTTFRLRSTVETIYRVLRCFSKQTNKRLVVD